MRMSVVTRRARPPFWLETLVSSPMPFRRRLCLPANLSARPCTRLSSPSFSRSMAGFSGPRVYAGLRRCLRLAAWLGRREFVLLEYDLQDIVHVLDEYEVYPLPYVLGDVLYVLSVPVREDDVRYLGTEGRQAFFLYAAYGQDAAAERDLARHGNILVDRGLREGGDKGSG